MDDGDRARERKVWKKLNESRVERLMQDKILVGGIEGIFFARRLFVIRKIWQWEIQFYESPCLKEWLNIEYFQMIFKLTTSFIVNSSCSILPRLKFRILITINIIRNVRKAHRRASNKDCNIVARRNFPGTELRNVSSEISTETRFTERSAKWHTVGLIHFEETRSRTITRSITVKRIKRWRGKNAGQ